MRTTLLHDRAIKLSKANVHVYSDSVLCFGKIHENSTSDQMGRFMDSKDYQELSRADRVRVEDFPRTHNTGDGRKLQKVCFELYGG